MSKTRILVVEDEAIVARDLISRLARLGYEPVGMTARGEEALTLVEQLRPDLVLMDIQLAGELDGISAATAIREQFETPVAFLTAYADEGVLQRAKIAEPFGYIIKPFDERELHSVIEVGLYKHRVEARLRESEAKFATVFRDSPAMITLSTLDDGSFLEVNEAFLKSSGVRAEEVTGKTSTWLGWIGAENWERLLKHLHVDGRVNNLEFTATARDGRRIECLFSGGIVEVGGRQRLLSTVLDVTDRKRVEGQLRQAQKMEAVGQLAGGVAHDFNNILAAMAMNLGLLRDTLVLDPETNESLLDLENEAARGAGLTRQLLAFSRKQTLEVKPLLLNDVLENLLKMLRRVLGERIAVEWKGQPGLPAVEADVGMMEQVVVNLCVNARDAMPDGGRLRLSTDLVTVDETDARANLNARAGEYVRLSVSDTGYGIDAAALSRIFEPFYTTKDVGQGTGLGLSIVHGIAKQHDGWVEVESTIGVGTTFRVLLPAKQLLVEAAVVVGQSALLRGRNELVLVVEDEKSVRALLSKTLQRYGYRVLSADSGPEAADLWAAHRSEISLLLTDLMLPGGMSGPALIERFRADRPELPVILSSGAIRDGAVPSIADVATLPKPFQMHTLLTVLRNCLDERLSPTRNTPQRTKP
jgi:PAS domain S-box-containing protein